MSIKIKSVLVMMFLTLLSGCASTETRENGNKSLVDQYYEAGKAYQQGAYQKAEMLYRKLEKIQPNNVTVLLRLGNINLRQKKYDQALSYYQKVIAIKPRSARAHYNIAALYLELSEKHFRYYSANAANNDIPPGLIKLLTSIQRFSDGRTKSANPLDAITSLIVKQKTADSSN